MIKKERLTVIAEILEKEPVASQQELVAALAKRGIDVQQSSISRDLAALNYVKVTGANGVTHYQKILASDSRDRDHLHEMVSEVMISITRIQFMNVIKTLPANGNLLAAVIDDLAMPEVVGTLAGHDTIYVTSPDEETATRLYDELLEYLSLTDIY
ncbi:ArgR family transcriptional regulator [Periweissella cryptocerci]|uniref:Arginine repressor n=1 Tax=Periweissella cryptocerci TaxID=2506420 RepID=A0A4P6YVY3_9LACO|nr:ArgR family transcriptional regulator [Periweissella cryptocerci]QBO36926.1 ArgR family transcriptional regulator [Periweissella cryptocerci]